MLGLPQTPEISIAQRVLGITDRSQKRDAVLQAHATLTGRSLDSAGLDNEYHSTEDQEFFRSIWGVEELLDGEYRSVHILNCWSTYQRMIRYGQPGNGNASALLIGSASPLSSRAFEVLARDVLGADKAYIVDIEGGDDKWKHGISLQASGLELPLDDDSIDFAVTNRLQRVLKNRGPELPQKQKNLQLLTEIERVLAPGGQLLMSSEWVPGQSQRALWQGGNRIRALIELRREVRTFRREMASALAELGMKSVIKPTVQPQSYDYLFDPTVSPRQGEKRREGAIDIYARKPKRS